MQTRTPNKLLSALKNSWHYVAIFIAAILRLVSSCGQYPFSMPKFMKYVTDEEHSPYEPAVTISATAFAAIMNLTIYIPAMYFHMKDPSNNHAERQPLRWPYKALHFFLYRGLGYASILSSGIGAYLNSISLIERVFGMEDEKVSTNNMYALEATAIIFALGNMYSNISRRLKSYEENTYTFAHGLQEGTLPKDRHVIYATGISFFGVACSPFMGYFSGSHAIMRIRGYKPSENAIHWFGVYSAITLTNFQLFTQPPSIYKKLRKTNELLQVKHRHLLDRPISVLTKTVGIGDSITSGTTNFIAMIATSRDALGVDPKNPELIATAIIASCSTSVMQYYFGVLETYGEVRKDYYRFYGGNDSKIYSQVATSPDDPNIEAVANETLTIVGMGGLFDRSPLVINQEPMPPLTSARVSIA